MSAFLERVLAEKMRDLSRCRTERPEEGLERSGPDRSVRDFEAAITGGNRIIAEVKKKSPSVAAFRQSADPEDLARIYTENGAAAISVVTDERNFGTSLFDVERIRQAVPLPVLVKDFIVDRYQVTEAWAAGADALLLIARILSREDLQSLFDQVSGFGMHALVECHCTSDIQKAESVGARIIGINNRDLDTMIVSTDTTRRLASFSRTNALIISESGVGRREEIEALSAVGVDAFLIGGALLDSDHPGKKLRSLLAAGGGEGSDG